MAGYGVVSVTGLAASVAGAAASRPPSPIIEPASQSLAKRDRANRRRITRCLLELVVVISPGRAGVCPLILADSTKLR
jgi:hypothetical protein